MFEWSLRVQPKTLWRWNPSQNINSNSHSRYFLAPGRVARQTVIVKEDFQMNPRRPCEPTRIILQVALIILSGRHR
jgi:hypothetical protein